VATAYCPQCDAAISVSAPQDGDRVVCPGCNVELEVISVDPFDVYFPVGYDEDWGEDEDEDEDWEDEW
jgi:alpha-aminoadipate carrier protein LysW